MSQTVKDIWKARRRPDRWKVASARPRRNITRCPWPELPGRRILLEVELKDADWNTIEPIPVTGVAKTEPERPPLSAKTLELIGFLDSLLGKEVQEDDETWERLERTIDENRLSDRKFFT